MAQDEHKMLFDLQRGRRKTAVKVVYAILAVLMGASLFLVVGPVNIGELFGGSSASSSASKLFDEQAERIEARLVKDPTNEQLLLQLTRARINGGNSQIEVVSETEVPTVSPEARKDFEGGSEAWSRYLKNAKEPSPTGAQLVAGTFFRLAESSTSVLEAQEYVAKATKAQQVAADQSPSLGSLSTLAIYQYFNGEFAAGDKTTKQAAAKSSSKAEGKNVEKQLAQYREQSKKFDEQKKELAKVQKEVGKEQLQNPLGLSGTSGSLGE
jgi:hypothetical protein